MFFADDLARAGVFVYDPAVFMPEQLAWPVLAIEICSEKTPDRKERFDVPQRALEAIAVDFQEYYWQERSRFAKLVVK